MRFLRSKHGLFTLILVALYVASYTGFKCVRPSFLTSNAGPGQWYYRAFYPLRYITASRPKWYWRSLSKGHWLTAKIVRNNPGNGYLNFDLPEGPQRAWSG